MSGVLVTGDSGFLGSNLVLELKNRGYSVRGLSRSSPDIKLDITTLDAQEVLPEVDVVVHTAASMEFNNIALNHEVNVVATRKLLNAVIYNGIGRFIYISTAFLFDNNPYERSKKEAEKYLLQKCKSNHIELTIIRPSVIVEDSRLRGKTPTNGVYYGLRILRQALDWYKRDNGESAGDMQVRIRANPDGKMNVIPVDFVTETILDAIEKRKTDIIYATHPRPRTIKFLEQPLSEILGVEIKFVQDFVPNSIERVIGRMNQVYMKYLQGYDLPSDIDCPEINQDFVKESSRIELDHIKE